MNTTADHVQAQIDSRIDRLEKWWYHRGSNKISGYEFFLACMRKHGEFAGEFELAHLASYFHVRVFNRQPGRDKRVAFKN